MIRKAFVVRVNPDAHEEYQRRYNPIWSKLEAVLKSHGVHNYAVYLDKARNLLLAAVEIESEERWSAVASIDACQRWWRYMTDVMPASPDNSPMSSELQGVFYLPQLPNVPEVSPVQYFKFRFEKLNILHLPVSYTSLIRCEQITKIMNNPLMIHVVYLDNHYVHYSANLTFHSVSNCHCLPTYRLSPLDRSTITID